MSERLLGRAATVCLHMALSFGALSAANATASYYRTRRGSYAGSHQYLADPGMSRLSATTISRSQESCNQWNNAPGNSDFHFKKGNAVRELVIVDGNVQNKHLILGQMKPGLDVVEIKSGTGGIDALARILRNYTALDAVHIVSHAEAGVLHIGGQKIDQDVLQQQVAAFTVINNAIREGGDLLLYGCDLAKDESGLLDLIRDNTHVDIAASADKTGNEQYGGNWELEVRKGDIDAKPLPESLALKDFTGTLQFSGTIDFSQVKDAGSYYTVNPAIDSKFWESPARNHTLIVDGVAGPTYTFGDYASFGAYHAETAVVLRFDANETFNPKSVKLFNWASSTCRYTITSDKGGSMTTGVLSTFGGTETLDISSLPAGTSTLTITSNGALYGAVDNLELQNLQAPAANTAPVASSISITGIRVVGETLTGAYTFTDADGDPESGSAYQWYRSINASGTGKVPIATATAATYTLQVADQGMYISFGVTPSDGSTPGTPVESSIRVPWLLR